MSDGSDIPFGAETAAEEAAENQCVPVSALATVDDQDAPSQPAPGDRVNYQVEGEVTRVEGGHAFVKVTAINGEPVTPPAATEPDSEAEEFNSLRGAAAALPGGMGGL